jgi:WD40 repeat protein
VRGLSLAREKGWLLAWDEKQWLYLLNHAGVVQAQKHMPGAVIAACSADDGSAYAAVGARGEVFWLAPDLMPRWERNLPNAAVGVAIDPHGQYLAASDAKGNLHLFDRLGRPVSQVESPRPLHYLTFVPTGTALIGAGDYGLVACFDLAGKWLWRDGLVAHVGSLSVTGDGDRIALACFSEGLQRYDLSGKRLERLSVAGPCRLASLSFEGDRILTAYQNKQVHLLDAQGAELGSLTLERSVTALALGALGDSAAVALVEGPILGLEIR